MNKIIAVIPARSGSQGIKNKNLIDFCGKPLLGWTVESAIKSKKFDKVIVSTDSHDIATSAKLFGAEVPFIRPSHLAKNDVHAVHVVLHTLDYLYSNNYKPDAVAMLLPTSPLRSPNDIKNSIKLYRKRSLNSVIGICATGKNINNLRYCDKGVLSFISNGIEPNLQRQDQKEIFTVNGAIFISNVARLRKYGTFHSPEAYAFEMEKQNSIDINSVEDLAAAKKYYMESNENTSHW